MLTANPRATRISCPDGLNFDVLADYTPDGSNSIGFHETA